MASRLLNTLLSLAVVVACASCLSAGPMPGMTFASVSPSDRAGGEVGMGVVPGFFLSDAVKAKGDVGDVRHLQGTALVEPFSGWAQDLSLGGRWVNSGDDAVIEPLVRYRTAVDDEERLAWGITGFGTVHHFAKEGASYDAVRGGAELAMDLRITPRWRWFESHLTFGGSLTGIGASGQWCVNESGWAGDCGSEGQVGRASGSLSGAYFAGFAGITFDVARNFESIFHGLRVTLAVAGGRQPGMTPSSGGGELPDPQAPPPQWQWRQGASRPWLGLGVYLTVGLGRAGAKRSAAAP